MNDVIDTTAAYVNIFICYGFPQEMLNIPKLASCRYAESWTFSLKSPIVFVLKLVVEIAS